MGFEYVLAIGPIETFYISVSARFSGLYVLDLDILHFTLVYKYPREYLRAVVPPNGQRLAVDLYGLSEILHHPYPGHGEVSLHAMRLTVEVVHQVEHPEAPTCYQAV